MSHENWYNILTDRLPDSVEVNGKTYPVHTSFRDWISFFFLHEDADLTDIEKVTLAMNWYRNTIPGNKADAYQALQEFAACERLPKSKRKATGVRSTPVFSYLHDSVYLFSDFLRYYQINLQTTAALVCIYCII